MTRWIRFNHKDVVAYGTLEGETIRVHEGSPFGANRPTDWMLPLSEVKVLTPCDPTKMVALWNNFRALAAKLGQAIPPEPLYFIKSPSAFAATGTPIRVPKSYAGKVIFEGELGVVIGRRCSGVSEAEAPGHILGYTCVNDVTAVELLKKDASFEQWTRAKSFDTFGVFGPVIATGLDPLQLSIRAVLDGTERQNYPVSDMVFPPARLVSLISQDMTLEAGDIIACGTSVGVGSMKPGAEIAISIEGIGEIRNRFG